MSCMYLQVAAGTRVPKRHRCGDWKEGRALGLNGTPTGLPAEDASRSSY